MSKEPSQAGSGFGDAEPEQGGADAVPDKTTGAATGDDDKGAELDE